jgi:Flp pilus assembly secretin CpaC
MRTMLIAALTLVATPALAQSVQINIDEARPLRMSTPITGVVVGNAGIADVIVHDANMLFVLGKSVGTTSVVAVDARGRTVYNGTVEVRSVENDGLVIVQRGAGSTNTFQCSERCVAVVSPYAGNDGNSAAAANATARSTFARGSGGN